jgi:DNA repair exonuclease SbcCD ATPase subunit
MGPDLCLNKQKSNDRVIIYHLADIHIRNERRDEYHAIFDKVFASIRADETPIERKLVVIAGDIFDSKTTLSAENIDDFYYFMMGLSELCFQIITVVGNHDCNINNSCKLDLISPLAKNVPLIKHMTKNETFVVNLDARSVAFNFKNVYLTSPKKAAESEFPFSQDSDVNILLIHSEIDGIEMTHLGGYKMSNPIKEEHMAHYDAVMAGHIHEYIRFDKCNGAYCGSLVQQTRNETFTKGFIRWEFDLDSAKNEDSDLGSARIKISHAFVPICNERGFIKHRISDKTVLDLNGEGAYKSMNVLPGMSAADIAACIPSRPYNVIVETTGANEAAVRTLSEDVRSRYGIEPEINSRDMHLGKIDAVDANSTDNQLDIIRQILKEKSCATETIEEIVTMHQQHVGADGLVGARRPHKWCLQKLEWSNMFCYGEGNSIDFTKLNGAICGILAPNKSGKSAVLDILIYALFGRIMRGTTDYVVNKRYKHGFARVSFSIGPEQHVITRTLTRGELNKKTKILYTINGVNVTESKAIEINRVIQTNIGTYEEFVSTVVIQQDRSKGDDFIDMSVLKRNDFLSHLLDLDGLFKTQIDAIDDEIDEIKTEMKAGAEILKMNAVDLEVRLEELRKEKRTIEAHILTANEVIAKTEDVIPEQPPSAKDVENSIAAIENEIKRLERISSPEEIDRQKVQREHDLLVESLKQGRIRQDMAICDKKPAGYILVEDDLEDLKDELAECESLKRKTKIEDLIDNITRMKDKNAPLPSESRAELERLQAKIHGQLDVIGCTRFSNIERVARLMKKHTRVEFEDELSAMRRIENVTSSDSDSDSDSDVDVEAKLVEEEKKFATASALCRDVGAKEKELEDLMNKYDRSYERFHELFGALPSKEALEKCSSFVTNLNELEKTLTARVNDEKYLITRPVLAYGPNFRPPRAVLDEIAFQDADKIQAEIDQISDSLNIGFDSSARRLQSQFRFTQTCPNCTANRSVLQTINQGTAGGRSVLIARRQDLSTRKERVLKLKDEYSLSCFVDSKMKHYLLLQKQMSEISADLPLMEPHQIQFMLKHYDDIRANIEAGERIKLVLDELAPKKKAAAGLTVLHARIKTLRRAVLIKNETKKLRFGLSIEALTDIITLMKRGIDIEIIQRLNEVNAKIGIYVYRDSVESYEKIQSLSALRHKIACRAYHEAKMRIERYVSDSEKASALKKQLASYDARIELERLRKKLARKQTTLAELKVLERKYLEDKEKFRQHRVAIEAVSRARVSIAAVEARILETERLSVRLDELCAKKKRREMLALYRTCLDDKTGIPIKIISKNIDLISVYTNEILRRVADFKVEFTATETAQKVRLELMIHQGGIVVPVDTGSGYQKFIISLALRNAFIKISRSSPRFIMIDEGFGCLDAENIVKITDVIPSLKSMYDFMFIITHLDSVNKIIESAIPIVMNGEDSLIVDSSSGDEEKAQQEQMPLNNSVVPDAGPAPADVPSAGPAPVIGNIKEEVDPLRVRCCLCKKILKKSSWSNHARTKAHLARAV